MERIYAEERRHKTKLGSGEMIQPQNRTNENKESKATK